jgi:4-hydroxybenzoate polyprenyltransferase
MRRQSPFADKEASMSLLWILVLIIIIAALFGGIAVNNWLFLLLVIALVLALVNYL